MSSFEKECKDATIRLLDAIGSSDPKFLKEAGLMFHPNFRGYGSSLVEKYTSGKFMQEFLLEQATQMPGGASITIQELHFSEINESVGEIIAEVSFEIKTSRGLAIIELMRLTAVLVKSDKDLLFKQIHSSVPDRSAIDQTIIPGSTEPRIYESVSILFTDFSGFTAMTSTIPPQKLLSELNEIFSFFDKIMTANNLTKIKIIGDAYMAIAGLKEQSNHAIAAVKAAKKILEYLEERNSRSAIKWRTRIGIHSGQVIGGVIGSQDLSFDVYGDAVNLASAVEQKGQVDKINISAYTYDLVRERFDCEYRGKIEIKDKRMIDMYFVS